MPCREGRWRSGKTPAASPSLKAPPVPCPPIWRGEAAVPPRAAWRPCARPGKNRLCQNQTGSGALSVPVHPAPGYRMDTDRKSVVQGKSVYVSVDLGGRSIINKIHTARNDNRNKKKISQ